MQLCGGILRIHNRSQPFKAIHILRAILLTLVGAAEGEGCQDSAYFTLVGEAAISALKAIPGPRTDMLHFQAADRNEETIRRLRRCTPSLRLVALHVVRI